MAAHISNAYKDRVFRDAWWYAAHEVGAYDRMYHLTTMGGLIATVQPDPATGGYAMVLWNRPEYPPVPLPAGNWKTVANACLRMIGLDIAFHTDWDEI